MALQHINPLFRNNLGLAALLCAGAGALLGRAGPLNPPAGPVAGTYKTLSEVEPRIAINATNTPGDADSVFRITLPGSYYLTGNITGAASKRAIEIASSDVTIDLMGFAVQGVAGTFDGIGTPGAGTFSDITIRNGAVTGFAQDGVDLNQSGANLGQQFLIDRVHVSACGGIGINTGGGAVIDRCTAVNNGGGGIRGNISCIVSGCVARLNVGDGIAVVNRANLVIDCTTESNTGSGISAGTACTITRCASASNTLDGIVCSAFCIISGNTCNNNGNGAGDGAGIHTTGSDNRIEGNNCTLADRGIDVSTNGSIIIRNTCSGNTTNWDVAPGNVCLVVQGATGGAILGNTGGVAPGSTDPNANVSY